MQASASADTPTSRAARHIRPPRATRTFPAIVGVMGPRLMTFATQISPFDLEDVLGHDPRSDRLDRVSDQEIRRVYAHVQRKTTRARRDAIVDYLRHQLFDGVIAAGFPAISIAIQNAIRFEEVAADASGGLGKMVLESGRSNRRIVLDGLARISGTLALVDMAMGDGDMTPEARAELRTQLEQFVLPVVFFAPKPGEPALDADDMGQLFHDFNFKATPVPGKDAIALDKSDPHIQATYYLRDNVHAIKFHGGMETRAANLSGKSPAIVTQPLLLRFVRAALEGEAWVEAGRNSRIEAPRLTRETRDRLLSGLGDFVDDFASAMGDRWPVRDGLHLSSTGWQALGVVYHDATVRAPVADLRKFAQALGALDWSRTAPMWAGLMQERKRPDGSTQLILGGAGATARREMVKLLRARFKLVAPGAATGGGETQ